jgi:pilus assembly protein CpaB
MLVRNLLLALGVLTLVAGIALAAVWFTQTARSPSSTEVKAPPPVVQPAILVAARAISSGTLLRAEDMTARDVGPTEIRPGSLVRGQESEFQGAVARRDFALGDSLIASDFVKPSERGFLAAVLKPGTRAVSISVDASQSASGLILPGDRIDVILIQSFGDTVAPSRKEVAETVLVDVRAIAVDQALNASAKAASTERRVGTLESQLPKTVTLEVNPQQAEVLLVAGQLGRLGVSVRALEKSGAPAAAGGTAPTWASDVSPALRQMGTGARDQRPFTTGSSIENSIRTVPPRGAKLGAPVAAAESPIAAEGAVSAPVGVQGVTQ